MSFQIVHDTYRNGTACLSIVRSDGQRLQGANGQVLKFRTRAAAERKIRKLTR